LPVKPSYATNVQDVFIYTHYRNMFRPIWWPSSGESYIILKEVAISTTDPLCLVQLCVSCRQLIAVVFLCIKDLNILNKINKIILNICCGGRFY
jgi:hypothetical protein